MMYAAPSLDGVAAQALRGDIRNVTPLITPQAHEIHYRSDFSSKYLIIFAIAQGLDSGPDVLGAPAADWRG